MAHRLFRAHWMTVALALTVVVGASSEIPGLRPTPVGAFTLIEPLDHFKCYSIREGQPPNVLVDLSDQFDPPTPPGTTAPAQEPTLVTIPVLFCNPTQKTVFDAAGAPHVTQIINRDHHLKMYFITEQGPTQPRTIIVRNQFDPSANGQKLAVFRPILLAVPTQKAQHSFPVGLDHFKCYAARGEPVQRAAVLRDQWDNRQQEQIKVLDPVVFCNPATKIHDDQTTPPVGRPEPSHLTCYRFVPPSATSRNVTVRNQFGRENIVAVNARILCVPSAKFLVRGK